MIRKLGIGLRLLDELDDEEEDWPPEVEGAGVVEGAGEGACCAWTELETKTRAASKIEAKVFIRP